jgi:UDP-N-acetylmuramoyl-L-alanyl-D-glutamate--2,6-diaminopimelate ligase
MMAVSPTDNRTTLGFLLAGFETSPALVDTTIAAIQTDSRKVRPGDLFIALEGTKVSGIDFINNAISQGAVAVLVDADAAVATTSFRTAVYKLAGLRNKSGLIAARYYGDPSRHMNVTGITGTNGKTSVAWFLAQTLADNGLHKVGSIGTLGYGIFGKLVEGVNTTPDAFILQALLARFHAEQVEDVVMEVSSHALDQDRVSGINFDTAIFTNLGRDHLDYHADLQSYANAKKKLFAMDGLKNAVINIDDSLGKALATRLDPAVNLITYGIDNNEHEQTKQSPLVAATVRHELINSLLLDIKSPWGAAELDVPLTGRYNVWNILASLSVLCLRGIPFTTALQRLAQIQGVPGRLELFGNESSARIFVDYSHTPDALEQALQSLRSLCVGKLVCVFGCGGDRDRGKRPEMGSVAEHYADQIILTSDNPRNEAPDQIIQDIYRGMQGHKRITLEPDRAQAIRTAIACSSPADIVLIAGKGHETWQEIGTTKIPFSDRQMVRNLLGARG